MSPAAPPANPQTPPPPGLLNWPPFWFFILLVLAVSAVGYITFERHKSNTRQEEIRLLATIADLKVEELTKWREERIGDAETLARCPLLGRELEKWSQSGMRPDESRELILERMKLTAHAYGYREIFLSDASGKPILATSPDAPAPASSELQAVHDAIRTQKVLFADIGSSSSTRSVGIAAPILATRSTAPKTIGVIYMQIDPSRFLSPLLKTTQLTSQSMEIVLVRREGNDVVFLNIPTAPGSPSLLRHPLTKSNLPAAMAVLGTQTEAEGVDYRGMPVFASMRKIPGSSWFLAVKVNQQEIFGPIDRAASLMASAAIVLIALTGVAVNLWWRSQRASFQVSQLQAQATRVALAQHFDYLAKYANDIILLADSHGRIVEANDRALAEYGYERDELLALTAPDLRAPETRAGLKVLWEQLATHDNALRFETLHQRRDRTTFPVEVSARRIVVNGEQFYHEIIHDITERRQAEAVLKSSEERFRRLVKLAPIPLFYVSKGGVIQDFNDRFAQVFGYTHDDIPTLEEWWRLAYPDEAYRQRAVATWDAAVQAAAKTGQDIQPIEYNVTCKNGDVRVMEISGVMLGADFLATFIDLTSRKQAELDILRLNRLYGVLNRTNKMIVRVQERHKLFEEACRIAVEQGLFKMAWIGMVDEATHFVRPVAMYGNCGDYLKNIRISMDDIPEGRGPTGTALREGRHFICRDIEHEPYMAPWRDAALAMGFRSSAAFPLWTGGAVQGVFTVYAPETIWFNDEEISMLDELASDISFALDAIEQEAMRRQAEEKLRTASRYARSLIEASLDPLVTISPDGKITDVNAAAEQATGVSRRQLIGSDFSDYFTDPEQARAGYQEAFAKGLVTDYPLSIRHASGKVTDVLYNATVYRNEAGNVLGVFAAARDITERKQAQEALQRSKAQLMEAQHIARIGSWDWDAVSDTIWWSDEYCRIYGLTPGAPTPNYTAHLKIYTAESAARLDAAVKKAMSTGESYELDLEIAGTEEPGRWVTARGAVKRSVNGDISGLSGTAQDITERKNMEEEVRRLNVDLEQRVAKRTAQLEAANKELESFTYSMSHDLRVPLRAIDGFSRLVLKQYEEKLDDEGRRLLNVVRDNTKKMGQLIDGILAFSRAGRVEIKASEADMEALAREVWQELEPSLAGRDVHLDIKSLPKVQGDPAMLRQVWANLLGNAAKFTKPRATARIEAGSSLSGGEYTFYVKDNGVGFDQQYVHKLFGVFQRLHGVDEFEGTGIGLAIVKRIVTRHGGRMWAEGKINEGTTFYFSLPSSARQGEIWKAGENQYLPEQK